MDALSLNTGAIQGERSMDRAKHLAQRMEAAQGSESETNEVAKEFSALLGTMLVKNLRKSLPNGFFGTGPGTDIMNGWLDEHVGRTLADGWNLDIAGMVRVSLESDGPRSTQDAQAGESA